MHFKSFVLPFLLITLISIVGCASREQIPKMHPETPVASPVISPHDRENAIIAIENLKDDSNKWNCNDAMSYLYLRREQLRDILVENLDNPDSQTKQALIRILCETESFKPDESFFRLVLDQLEAPFTLDLMSHHSIKYDFIGYLATKSPEFHNVIASYLNRKNIFVIYAVTHSLNAGGMLDQHYRDYNEEVMNQIIGNLFETNIPYGKSYAVRTCLMLGDFCLAYSHLDTLGSDNVGKEYYLAELVLRAIADPNPKWLNKIREFGCILESYYLKKASTYPHGFVPLSDVLVNHKPRFLGERTYSPPLQ